MASLRKLRGKYYARLRVNGREKLLPLKTSHKPDAERRLRLINDKEWLVIARLEEDLVLEELPSITQSVDLFIKESKNRQLSPRTIGSYSNALSRFKEVIRGDKRVDRISKPDIEKLLNHLNNTYNPVSVNSLIKSINTYLNWLRNKYNIDLPPKIKEFRVEKKLPE
ncbi:MAG: phage integrase N-terminal SAM-like domain-containing protein, partial [Candidatus Marinimicrobia bacterium]|nr:phage integrase N-terminal SAM-like domain-containing protein [Candidatus Neomarinimicrobiota bacterium]